MEYFIGIATSILVQFIKVHARSSKLGTYAILFAASFGLAAFYVYFSTTELWSVFVTIATVAGAFHNFILRHFEDLPETFELEHRFDD